MAITITGDLDYLRKVRAALDPTDTEMEELAALALERNLERTARGVDAYGNPFEPYSTKGPYYFNPAPDGAAPHERKQAVHAWRRAHPKAAGAGRVSMTGHTLVYPSYAAFKLAVTGDSTVNLRGMHPIHMLTSMEVWISGVAQSSAGFRSAATAAAQRALGHIRGVAARNLPVRRFLGMNDEDRAAIQAKRAEQIAERISRL